MEEKKKKRPTQSDLVLCIFEYQVQPDVRPPIFVFLV
jgi:hypothetical protein